MISEVDNTFENDSHHSTVQPSNNKATPEIIFPSTELSKTPDAAPKCSENTEEVEDVLNTASPVSTNFQINSVHDESLNETFDGDNDEMHNTSNVEGNVEETDSIPNVSVVENLTNDDSAKKIKIDHKTEKISQFPLGRIKDIMKSDPDVNIVGAECVFLLAKATEMFLQKLAKEIHIITIRNKKKTLQKRDLDAVIAENPIFEFLEGALE